MTEPERKTVTPAFCAPGAGDWRELVAENAANNDQQEQARKAKDELKNVLLASLQMQHLVVLAGSGCSLSAGGPSMLNLWNDAVGETPSDMAKGTSRKVNHDLKIGRAHV